jgi:DNA-binding NarL/FixJ family response regulator
MAAIIKKRDKKVSPMDKIRLAVVDDHPLFREGVASILGSEPDIEIVGQGASAEAAIQIAQTQQPDIMLLDINMPGGGVYATQAIKAAAPGVRLVILTGADEDEYVFETLKAGAHAYLLKGVMSRELIDVLHLVMAGQSYVSPILAASLLRGVSKAAPAAAQPQKNVLDELSERERQIVTLIADGLSNLEIGQRLFLSEKTVKHYVTGILQKLNVQNRVQAALLAQKNNK